MTTEVLWPWAVSRTTRGSILAAGLTLPVAWPPGVLASAPRLAAISPHTTAVTRIKPISNKPFVLLLVSMVTTLLLLVDGEPADQSSPARGGRRECGTREPGTRM